MATILKVWRQIENPIPSDTYLLGEHSCQISPQSDMKRQNLSLFGRRSPQEEEKEENEQDE